MDWAYRLLATGTLDPLGAAVVLHLGWRDAPSQRTDKGIARALGQHVSSVRKATAKLVEAKHIVRRSGMWVACETVAIVEERPDAKRPDRAATDGPVPLSGTCHSVASPVPLSGTAKCYPVAPKRKEKIEKARAPFRSASWAARPPLRSGERPAFEVGSLSGSDLAPYQLSRVRSGQSVLIEGEILQPGSARFDALRQAVRSQDAEKRGVA